MAKSKSNNIKNLKMSKPSSFEYHINLADKKDKKKFIERVKKIVRSSTEYRDYIQFLKEHMDLNSCIFFQNVTNEKKRRISIEMHHEPFTLTDYVTTVVNKYEKEGLPANDLLVADEVLELHYKNAVGLVPLSKTAHQIIHSENQKLMVPLNMCYGQYSDFLEEYEPYIDEDLIIKLKRKMEMTENLTEESFNDIKREFTYLDVDGYEDIEKMELEHQVSIA